jgi:site-specific DNA-cytosine methylase
MQGGRRQPFIAKETQIRRLTPLECERLQGFPDVEKSSIIAVWKNENANGVEVSLCGKDTDQNSVVQNSVRINCEENGVDIHSQGKCLLNAKGVERKNWSHPLMQLEDFVQLLVGINTIVEKEIGLGGEVSHQKELCSTLHKSGNRHEWQFGNEIMQPVGDVKNDSTTLKELLKFITSDLSSTEISEQKLATLYSFVIRAITGFIPKETQNQNIFTIEINTKVGWTYGVSDTQRYKTLGNAVTVNVIKDICKKLL